MRSQGLSKKAVDETIAKAFKVRIDDPNVHHDKDKRMVGDTIRKVVMVFILIPPLLVIHLKLTSDDGKKYLMKARLRGKK